ncbi:MAG: DUF4242 domain-containing protein [Gammaproteobacteria bacterium]|nr:DUF4242 domain-containing protein [Gammaproteobacteria bacterium]MDH4256468.1 DUF4242 domain-containing protein [Gammaproteobacteria bacterium]MDH5311245.1 DUF4242 domain-containing protein [Gammaproteobacteria bacterium]
MDRGSGLTDVYVARSANALRAAGANIDTGPTDCFRMHRVQWQETCVSEDGTQLICRFRAPDAESVRLALRMSGIPFDSVWTGASGRIEPGARLAGDDNR